MTGTLSPTFFREFFQLLFDGGNYGGIYQNHIEKISLNQTNTSPM